MRTFAIMKRILLIMLFIYSQHNQAQNINDKISYVSLNKDTLILPNDDLGKLIASTWVCGRIRKAPIIILTNEAIIKRKNEILFETELTNKK